MANLSNLFRGLSKAISARRWLSPGISRRRRANGLIPAVLEDRLLLDTRTWTGGALLNDKWSDKDNWSGRVVPKAGDDIVFPSGIGLLDRNTNMDIVSASFRDITFQDSDFKVTGRAFTITGKLTKAGPSGIDEIQNDITFSTAAHTIDIASGQLTLSGSLKGSRSQGVGSVTKTGIGGLVFQGSTANTLAQDLIINHGELVMNKSNSVAAYGGLSIIVAGAQIGDRPKLDIFQSKAFALLPSVKIETFAGAAAQAEMIVDAGDVVRTGSLNLFGGLIRGGGTLQLGGDVTVASSQNMPFNSVMSVAAVNLGSNIRNITVNSGAILDIQSQIQESTTFGVAKQGFRKRGDGAIEMSRHGSTGTIFLPNTYAGQTVIIEGTLMIHSSDAVTPVTLIPGDMIVGTVGSSMFASYDSTVKRAIASKSRVLVQGTGILNVQHEVFQTLDVKDQAVVNNRRTNISEVLAVTGMASFSGNSKLGGTTVNSHYIFHQFKIDNAALVVPGAAVILETDDLTLTGAQLEFPSDVESKLNISGTVHVLPSSVSSSIKGRMKSEQSFIQFEVADGSALDDLVVDAIIMKGNLPPGNLNLDQKFKKTGTGSLLINNRLIPDSSSVNAPTNIEMVVESGVFFATGFDCFLTEVGTATVGGGNLRSISASNKTTVTPGIRGVGILNAIGVGLSGADSKLQIELNGLIPGIQHDQLVVQHLFTGHSDLTDAPVLEVIVGFTTSLNQVFKIVDITDPTDTNLRRFRSPAGVLLNEGSVFTAGGVNFQISYVGGDGNDITLKRVNASPAFQNRSITPSIIEGGVVTLSGLITEPDVEDTFFLDVDWGDGTEETFTFAPGSPRQVAVSHRYLNDAPNNSPLDTYPVQLVWHDEHGGSNSATLQTVVKNVAPEVSNLSFDAPPVHGQPAVLRGSVFDPGSQDQITLRIDWGDGSAIEILQVAPGQATFAASHLYAAPGNYRVTVQAADERASGKKNSLKIRVA